MDTTEVLERVPEVAEALRDARGSAGPHWTLHVREAADGEWTGVPVSNFAQSRTAGLALSELGFHVCVQDHKGCVRLRMWPPRLD